MKAIKYFIPVFIISSLVGVYVVEGHFRLIGLWAYGFLEIPVLMSKGAISGFYKWPLLVMYAAHFSIIMLPILDHKSRIRAMTFLPGIYLAILSLFGLSALPHYWLFISTYIMFLIVRFRTETRANRLNMF